MGCCAPDYRGLRAPVGGKAQSGIVGLSPHEHPGSRRVCGEQRLEWCPALCGHERGVDGNRGLRAVATPQAPKQGRAGSRVNTAVIRAGWVALLVLALSGLPTRLSAACKIGRLAELPVTMTGLRPLVSARINGADALFLADSGAFFSMITPAAAAEFKLRLGAAPYGLVVTGIGGEARVWLTTV